MKDQLNAYEYQGSTEQARIDNDYDSSNISYLYYLVDILLSKLAEISDK